MNLPQRKLQRLKNYNYSTNGAYFLTICVHNRINLFGNIENGILTLNNTGKMIDKIFCELIIKYENMKLINYIIMPNHMHCIVTIFNSTFLKDIENHSDNKRNGTRPFPTDEIPTFMRDFKSITTDEYIKMVKSHEVQPFSKHLWQKSYHDHIIRNEKTYNMIFEYIQTNPLRWKEDIFFYK